MTLAHKLTSADSRVLTTAGASVKGASVKIPGYFNFNTYFGSYGFFTVMIMGAIAASIYIWLVKKNITIKMPDSVPPAVSKAFTGIIPAIGALYVPGIITWLFTTYGATSVIEFISRTLQNPLMKLSQGYGAVLLITLLVQVFWFFGIHGTNVLGSVISSIWLTAQLANISAYNQGKSLPYTWTSSSFDLYAWIGGAGSTLLLLIAILLFSTREDQRSVAKLAFGPGIFNINEPVMFGLPVVLDPIYFIPFILAPVVMVTIGYFANMMGLVSPVKIQVVWSLPPILNSLIATLDWRAPLLQIVNMFVGFLIYIPFVKAANKIKPEI